MTRSEGTTTTAIRILSLSVALAIVLALAPASSGADSGRAARRLAKGTSQSPFASASELRTAAAEDGSVRVIVGLESSFAPEGGLSSKRVAAQRSGIRDARQALLRDLGDSRYEVVRRFDSIPYVAMEVSAAALARLEASGAVSSVTEDAALPPLLAESVPLIQGPTMWSAGFTGAGQTVAVLDTGVESSHSFLSGSVVSEACYSDGSCPNGLDTQTGAGAGAPCTYAPDGCKHGTHVAGIAAGSGGSFSGVAKEAGIIAVQVFSEFMGASCAGGEDPCALSYTSDQIAGLQRVYDLRGTYDIASVNLSLGGGRFSNTCDSENLAYKAAIANLRSTDIATVIAAGNGGFVDSISFPACLSNAVSVGSTTKTDQLSSFSNLSYFTSLLAPGSAINSSVPGNLFDVFYGTSMAAPHVAGAWALLKDAHPGATVDAILSALQTTGTLVTDARPGGSVTKPRINIADASAVLGGGAPQTLTVSKSGNGTGTVTSNDGGINCGATCSNSYNNGTVVTLTATPAASSSFTGWSGACAGTGSCQVTMDQARSVTATFTLTLQSHTLTVSKSGNGTGTVTSNDGGINCGATCSNSYNNGTVVTLTATPAASSSFTGWSGACAGTGSCQVTMDQARSVTATFTLDPPGSTRTLTVSKSGNGTGTVTSNDGGINCGATCSNSYNNGTVVTLTATPAASSSFTGWSGACAGTGSCQVTMDQARSVTATFTLTTQESSTVSTFGFKAKKRLFSGAVQLDADHPDCRTGRKVRLMKARPGEDATAGRSTSNDSGKWSVKVGRRTKGAFYALIAKNVIPAGDGAEVTCSSFRTKTIKIRPARRVISGKLLLK